MQRLSILILMISILQQVGCHSHQYANQNLSVVDQTTQQPIGNARLNVDYNPITCGGAFPFFASLQGDPRPTAATAITNNAGIATLRLATDWGFGGTITVQAAGYLTRRIETEGEPLPDVIDLQRQVLSSK